MDYEKAWKELEHVIKSNIDLHIIAFPDENPSVTDRMVLNSLRHMEALMKMIKERYSEEDE